MILDLIETRPGGSDRSTTVSCNVEQETFVYLQGRDSVFMDFGYDKGKIVFTVNGSEEIPQKIKEDYRISEDRFLMLRNYYQYLWLMPNKLNDPGTIIDEKIKSKDFFGKDALEMKVTYDPDVGSDTWYFYFDQNTFAMKRYQFFHDETKNDGEYIVLEDELELSGMRIPKNRSWYYNTDKTYLGTDILTN